jgi:gliding motility-associated-like protein
MLFRYILLLGFGFLGGSSLASQACEGQLGENIFLAGDFGSGADNVLAVDPEVAPGFSYSQFPPPIDGAYTVTNNTGNWAGIFPAWIEMGDNSPDPQGYMMVVNASFEPGLFYEQRVDGLCEGNTYQFSADIINMYRRGETGIQPNVTFLLDGQEFLNTGSIPEDETWKRYGFSFTIGTNQTSVTLSLRNNAPGGIGNDLAIDNISFRTCGPQARLLPLGEMELCQGTTETLTASFTGDQYENPAIQWQSFVAGAEEWMDLPGENGLSYTLPELPAGTFFFRYVLANGESNLPNPKCRVVSDPKRVRVLSRDFRVMDTICVGLTYPQGDNEYRDSGVYVDTLRSSRGCDSIVTLELTVLDDPGILANFDLQDPSCSNSQDGRVSLTSVANASAPFEFAFAGAAVREEGFISGLGEGVYSYAVEDRFGCRVQGQVALTARFPFSVDLGDDRLVELGDRVRLNVTALGTVANYRWEPADLVGCTSDCRVAELTPPETTTLRVTATSIRGCTATDSVRITVVKNRRVFIPNSFSPNGDGVNDFFAVFGEAPEVKSITRLEIYDRWGTQVFFRANVAANDPGGGWDGTVKGRPAPVGTYGYRAEVRFLDGFTKQYQGSFVLLR